MAVVTDVELRPIADERDPDDWRPESLAAFVSDPDASLAVIVEELAVGDRIPLHVHSIDEVLLYESGTAEVRFGDLTQEVRAGATAIVPAGLPHQTVNVGDEPVRLKAVFPSHVVDIRYLERVPAPGTGNDEPGPPVAYDMRAGEVVRIESDTAAAPPARRGTVFHGIELQPMAREANPDDWRPKSRAAIVADPVASVAVAVQEIAVGDGIPLHVHRIDEVFFFDGAGEIRIGDDVHAVADGTIAFVAAGVPHAARNTGHALLRFRAMFPSHVVDLRYLERNPAPGTEGQAPQPGVAYDAHTGEVRRLEPADAAAL